MSTTLLSGLRHQVKGKAVHRRTVVADEVAAGFAKGVAAPGPTTRGIKGGLITLWMLLEVWLYSFYLERKKARLVLRWMKVQLGAISEVSSAVGRRCLFAMGFAYIFYGLMMAVCDTERDIRRLCDLFSSWYAAFAPVVILAMV